MCSPTIAFGLMAATTVAGTALNVYGAYKEAEAENKAIEYNADILRNNADISRLQADYAKERGKANVQMHRMQLSKLMGKQRAAFSASGVVVDEGSALDVALDTATYGEFDALTIKHDAAMEAWGYEMQAADLEKRAEMLEKSGVDPSLAMASSLLTGAGQVGSQYLQYKRYGG